MLVDIYICMTVQCSIQYKLNLGCNRQTDRRADRQTGRQTDRQAGGQTDRQTDRQAGRRADRQTD